MGEVDDLGRARAGTWNASWSGGRFWALDPLPEDIFFDDIVSGLSKTCRYGGQIREFYSVAEHSVVVSLYAQKFAHASSILAGQNMDYAHHRGVLAGQLGILHDASEAYIGDIPWPLKIQPEVSSWYKPLEKRWTQTIFTRFGVDWAGNESLWEIVSECDMRIRLDEIEALTIDPDLWPRYGRYDASSPLGAHIEALSHDRAAQIFTLRFSELFPGLGTL